MTRFFFLHLHKTAGTSLWRSLHNQFTDAELYPGVQDDSLTERTFVPEYLQARYLARRDEIRVVTGHFPLCTLEMLGDAFQTFTVLRPPLERVTSVLRRPSTAILRVTWASVTPTATSREAMAPSRR